MDGVYFTFCETVVPSFSVITSSGNVFMCSDSATDRRQFDRAAFLRCVSVWLLCYRVCLGFVSGCFFRVEIHGRLIHVQ